MTRKEKEAALRAHIEAVAGKPCLWGRDDCCRWAADWAERVLGRSLQLPVYQGELAARRLIAKAGGFEALVSTALADAGLCETGVADYGDVGIWHRPSSSPIAVIMTSGGLVAARTEQGVTFVRPRGTTRFWSLP